MIIQNNKPAEQLFKQFCEGYANRNLPFLLNLCAQNISSWGSGLDEYRVGTKELEEQLRRDWSQSEQGQIEIISFVPTTEKSLWAAAKCRALVTINGEKFVFEHLRGTLLIEKEDEVWKIAHMHCSFPDFRNADSSSFPVN